MEINKELENILDDCKGCTHSENLYGHRMTLNTWSRSSGWFYCWLHGNADDPNDHGSRWKARSLVSWLVLSASGLHKLPGSLRPNASFWNHWSNQLESPSSGVQGNSKDHTGSLDVWSMPWARPTNQPNDDTELKPCRGRKISREVNVADQGVCGGDERQGRTEGDE